MLDANFSASSRKKIACIINPQAANKKWKRRKFLRKYLQENLPCQIIDSHQDKYQTIKIAKKLSLENQIIVAAGGDGTIADVVQGIIDSGRSKDVILGIIPLGSGNGFRKSLGIPKSVKKSVKLLHEGKTKEIDLIDIGGQKATFASIGATAEATLEKSQNRIPGLFGHIWAARNFLRMPEIEQEVELTDGMDDSGKNFKHKILRIKTFDCIIGKTDYFGYNWKIAPKACVDDGYIDITFFQVSGLKYLMFFPWIYLGRFQKTQMHFKAKKAIFRGKNLPIQYHGEVLGQKDEIELRILPRALKVIVPS